MNFPPQSHNQQRNNDFQLNPDPSQSRDISLSNLSQTQTKLNPPNNSSLGTGIQPQPSLSPSGDDFESRTLNALLQNGYGIGTEVSPQRTTKPNAINNLPTLASNSLYPPPLPSFQGQQHDPFTSTPDEESQKWGRFLGLMGRRKDGGLTIFFTSSYEIGGENDAGISRAC